MYNLNIFNYIISFIFIKETGHIVLKREQVII